MTHYNVSEDDLTGAIFYNTALEDDELTCGDLEKLESLATAMIAAGMAVDGCGRDFGLKIEVADLCDAIRVGATLRASAFEPVK
jgi:hypothetical protein